MSDTLVIRIDPALKRRLAERARDEDRSLSAYARRALREAVNR